MKLAEAEVVGPPEHEGDSEVITPPRPPHRRVSVSLIFTLTVLIGTVVTIYKVFPARPNVLLAEALARHRNPAIVWDLVAPTPEALRAWTIGIVGHDPPLPSILAGTAPTAKVVGASRIEVLDRDAALIRLELAGEPVTYIVQYTRTISPNDVERTDGDLRAIALRSGSYMRAVVGRDATASTWLPAFH